MNRIILTALLAIVAVGWTAPASAQEIEGKLRLHLETGVLSVVNVSPEEGDSDTITTIGPGTDGLGFGVGFGLTDQLILGGNLAVQHSSVGDSSVFSLSILPYIEFMLGTGDVRPFVGGALMFSLASSDNRSMTEFGLAGLGGVHIFLSDSFSFDLSGRLFFTTGSTSVETPAGDFDASFTSLGLLVLVGVSGWGV